MIRATAFAGKSVAVFGLGTSGNATALALRAGGASVSAWDDSEVSRAGAATAGLSVVDLQTADWAGFDSFVLAPGVPLTHPEPHWTVLKARDAGVEVIGDIEIFFRERRAVMPEATVIAITGTNGKSTTTALATHILQHAGFDAQMGGNIGRAVLTLDPFAAGRIYVLELSSFQIDLTPSLAPTVGVLLNLTPDHIDRHGTFDSYAAVKERLIAGAGVAVIGCDDEPVRAIAARRRAANKPVIEISTTHAVDDGYDLSSTKIARRTAGRAVREYAALDGIATLMGPHNAQNAVAAIAAVDQVGCAPGHPASIDWQNALATFPGLAHRLEQLGHIGRVRFVNDSKATNADSTEKALLTYRRDVFWIAGGKPKEGGIDGLLRYFPGIAKAYLIGDAAEEFYRTLDGHVAVERCGTLEAAVAAATRDALASDRAAPVVLLSPACASYDQFKNFEVRGDAFRSLVARLPGIELRHGS